MPTVCAAAARTATARVPVLQPTTAVRAWHARQTGQADIVGTNESGDAVVTRYVAPYHWNAIKAYRVARPIR